MELQFLKNIGWVLIFMLGFQSCTEKIDNIDLPKVEQKYVVEGYIENGLPPLVLISKSTPYFDPVAINDILNSYVSGAKVSVSDGTNTYELQEISLNSLIPLILAVNDSLDISPLLNSFTLYQLFKDYNFSFYTSLELMGKTNTQYDLRVEVAGQTLTATTFMPEAVTLDSVWFLQNPKQDSLFQLYARYTDNPNQIDRARYFTQRNNELMFPGLLNSVFDDESIFKLSGQTVDIPLERGWYKYDPNIDIETYLYFKKGDQVILRWCSIDKAHYDFWRTVEFDNAQQGNPFGRPTRVQSNVNGGLGIWGAYASSYYTVVAE